MDALHSKWTCKLHWVKGMLVMIGDHETLSHKTIIHISGWHASET